MAQEENYGEEIVLTDLIDVPTLQMIQDAFSDMTGMAALTTDIRGRQVTVGSNFCDFCMNEIRGTQEGRRCCEICDSKGAEDAHSSGRTVVYKCHSGLWEYAAPILLNDEVVGCFIGGQVLTEKPDRDECRKLAERIGADPDKLLEALENVVVRTTEQVERGARFLEEIAGFLSEMAYGSYLAKKANDDIKRAARMKTDFLANMSHEIRTPMNAVIGMAEMALREDLDETAMEYIEQIKSSGTALLTIINDILDYSKIESGKLEIIPEEYEPVSIINDVSNIVIEKLEGQSVELILDIDAAVPRLISGDDMRIKQVLVNIATNAVKFTKTGMIKLKVFFEKVTEDDIMLTYSVEDTGVGIREGDLERLFTSFQQLDSKRNRNSEGTGLGLAIANNLANLMGGGLEVSSVYGEGSVFSLVLPQKVIKGSPGVLVRDADKIRGYALMRSSYASQQFLDDGRSLGVSHSLLTDKYELMEIEPDDHTFFFVDNKLFDDDVRNYVRTHPQVRVVELVEHDSKDSDEGIPNVICVRKPLYSLNEALVYNHEESRITDFGARTQGEFDYEIPDAHLLLVDDNAINITVAEGLIEPLHANIDRALSGQEAIEKIKERGGYDLVFMDHMMPGMDGVETTRRIREQFPELKDMPIIALTANAFSEVKSEFMECGMNDFIAKPIEVRVLKQKLKYYLPSDMIKKVEMTEDKKQTKAVKKQKKSSLLIGDLDVTAAIGMLGNEKLFFKVLKDYYSVIEKKAASIKGFYEAGDIPAYTIEVHALKSASRQIGANELADLAMALEKAGHENDMDSINAYTQDMLDKYLSYLPVLAPHFPEEEKADEASKPAITPEVLMPVLDVMQEALDNLDMDAMDENYEKLKQYSFNEEGAALLTKLKEAYDGFDMDGAGEALEGLRGYNG